MTNAIESASTFTIPVEDGRPIVVRGEVLATQAWEVEPARPNYYGQTGHTKRRARLIRAEDGRLIYHAETAGTDPDEWAFLESRLWPGPDAIRTDDLMEPIKEILRLSGDDALTSITYRSLSEPPFNQVVHQENAPDLRLGGKLLAHGHVPLASQWGFYPKEPNPVMVFALSQGGYEVIWFARGRAGDESPANWILAQHCPTALDVYVALVWTARNRERTDIARGDIYASPSPIEPTATTVTLLELLAAADPAFQHIAYRIEGEEDPALQEWQRRHKEYVAKEEKAKREREEERQKSEAEWKAKNEERLRIEAEEEEQRRRQWALEEERRQAEEEERRKNAPPPQPTLADRTFEILQAALESENERIRIQAATALYLGEKMPSQSASDYWE